MLLIWIFAPSLWILTRHPQTFRKHRCAVRLVPRTASDTRQRQTAAVKLQHGAELLVRLLHADPGDSHEPQLQSNCQLSGNNMCSVHSKSWAVWPQWYDHPASPSLSLSIAHSLCHIHDWLKALWPKTKDLEQRHEEIQRKETNALFINAAAIIGPFISQWAPKLLITSTWSLFS